MRERKALECVVIARGTARALAAVWLKMIDLEGSTDPVRISGWTLGDSSHGPHMGKLRKSMWEIHPLTKIEIFRDGKWVEY